MEKQIFRLLLLFGFIFSGTLFAGSDSSAAENLLETGRNFFYGSVEDETQIEKGIAAFEQLAEKYPAMQGRSTVYIGALTALKGRHAFWVYTKYDLVKKGLKIMDTGIEQSPDDLEALFVHGSTCHFMPFFFGRSEEAQASFNRIVKLLPDHAHKYDQELMSNVIDFLIEHTELTNEEISKLKTIKSGLAEK